VQKQQKMVRQVVMRLMDGWQSLPNPTMPHPKKGKSRMVPAVEVNHE